MNKSYFITTAIDYTNDVIHIGHSYQKILADCIARYHRQLGNKTYFLTGTDEHGQKVEKAAIDNNISPKKFVDKISSIDKKEWDELNISYDRFIRTTDADHVKLCQEFYLKSKANGDIYLGKYEGLYCEGCEAYLQESDLINGRCPFHPNRIPSKITEENYFFRLSKYQGFLEDHIAKNPNFVQPESKRKEILSFIRDGLKDFSVSRQDVKWGIPIPDDTKHTLYVWFDALINYLTFGLEKKSWPADLHVLGKDNQRFHAIYWPAMLKSAGYPLPKTILVHDFISLNGQKISKTLGNVIRPSELIKKFGVDGVRYYFLRYGPLQNDTDISIDKISEVYNSDLANGLGNLISRIAKLCEVSQAKFDSPKQEFYEQVKNNFDNSFRVDLALAYLWTRISDLDQQINLKKPWEKNGTELVNILKPLVSEVQKIAYNLRPFLPSTSDKIEYQFKGPFIKSGELLFPRLI